MKIQESGENYLETIFILQKAGKDVRSVDIASEMGYSKPSVSRAVGILKTAGFITVGKGGSISFTQEGLARAKGVYERHSVIKSFLETTLGVDERTAERDACRIEHVISPETLDKIKQFGKK